MSPRLRRFVWGAAIVAVGLGLFVLYQRLLGATGGGAPGPGPVGTFVPSSLPGALLTPQSGVD